MHQIGIGVLGPVFRTYEPSQDRLVAVKAFHLDITPEQSRVLVESLERFIDTGFTGPGVVSPIAVGLEQDVPYLAQEYVAAESLETEIRHRAPTTLELALPLISQVAASLDSVHSQGVAHGAIHLRDIFVAPDDLWVNGFGVVQTLEELGLSAPIRRPYTAPEIIAGREWGGAADRFSLAAIAFELLTGRRITGTGGQMSDGIRSIDGLSDCDHVEEVFSVALADDPESRYSSAMGFVAALEMGVAVERNDTVGEESGDRNPAGTLDLLAGVEFQQQPTSEDESDFVNRVESSHHEDEILKGQITESSDRSDLNVDVESGADENSEIDASSVNPSIGGAEEGHDTVNPEAVSGIRDVEDQAAAEDFESALDRVVEASQDSNPISTGSDGQHGDDLEIRPDRNVGDHRYLWEEPDADNHYQTPEEVYESTTTGPESSGSLPLPETREPRRTWNWTLVLVIASAIFVGSFSYFLGVALSQNEGQIGERASPESLFSAVDEADSIGRARDNSVRRVFGGVETGSLSGQRKSEPDDDPASATLLDGLSAGQTIPTTERRQADSNLSNSIGFERSDNRSERPSEAQAVEIDSVPSAVAVRPEELLTGRATALETGWILVRTDIPGAIVAVDGRVRGRTPLSLAGMSFGSYHVEVSRPGFRSAERNIQISDMNAVSALGVTLVPSTALTAENITAREVGSLYVQSRPSGARVTVNGVTVGVTPFTIAMPVGRHEIRIDGEGYRLWITNIEIDSGRRTQVNASLERGNR